MASLTARVHQLQTLVTALRAGQHAVRHLLQSYPLLLCYACIANVACVAHMVHIWYSIEFNQGYAVYAGLFTDDAQASVNQAVAVACRPSSCTAPNQTVIAMLEMADVGLANL